MGSGKTYALLLDWLLRGATVEGANGLIVRRHARDITIRGGLWDEAKKVFAGTGANFRGGSNMDVEWADTGSTLSFRHLDEGGIERYKGPGFTWVGVEEASEVAASSILWILGQRMRSSLGIRSVMALTTNPAPLHPMRQWVDWYIGADGFPLRSRSGAITWMLRSTATDKLVFGETPEEVAELAEADPASAMSFTYVPSLLADNRALDQADPGYRKKFALVSAVERAKNLDGNWDAVPELGGMLRRPRWGVVTEPLSKIVKRVRGWDKAGTRPRPGSNPDFTAGALIEWDTEGRWYLSGLVVCREEPAEVLRLQRATATLDGPSVTQACFVDPGQAGKVDELTTRQNFMASTLCGQVVFESAGNRAHQKVLNATPMSRELEQGLGYIHAGPWLAEPYSDGGEAPSTIGDLLWSQVGVFVDPDGNAKDDVVDAMSVAHRVGQSVHIVVGSPRETAAEARRLVEQRQGLRQGRRRGYGGRR